MIEIPATSAATSTEITPGPVREAERIASIDVLRGFAVLGILVMNIQSFSMIGSAYINPTAWGDLTGANYGVWYLCHLLADMKFMAIFSMLFGAGIVLMTSRREAVSGRSAGFHYARMGWLAIFGLLHAYLLWYGDILFTYAACGAVVYLFRRWRPSRLIAAGLIAVAIASGTQLLFHFTMPHWPAEAVQEIVKYWRPKGELLAGELQAYRGGWFDQLGHRAETAFFFQTFLLVMEFAWRAGGLMLVGMGLYKLGVFNADRSTRTYVIYVALGVLVGLPIVAYGVHRNFTVEWEATACFFAGPQFNYWGSLFVALGWIGLVMLACRLGRASSATRTLGAVGQMALTNYLLQTVICTTLFYGHGFGLFGKVDRVTQIGFVVSVWIALLILSPIWLHHFRFGPAEWLWRSLTYRKAQPMRRV